MSFEDHKGEVFQIRSARLGDVENQPDVAVVQFGEHPDGSGRLYTFLASSQMLLDLAEQMKGKAESMRRSAH